MEYEVKDAGTWKKEVLITVPADEIQKKRRDILKELGGSAEVPGFRIGHTPFEILEVRFAKQIAEELKSKVLKDAVSEVLEKAALKPVSVPDVDTGSIEIKREEPLRFSFMVEVRPEFEVPDYKAITVEKPRIEVSDEDIETALADLQERFADYQPITEPAASGDLVIGDYTISVDGEPKAEEKEAGLFLPHNAEATCITGAEPFPVPRQSLDGAGVGDTRESTFDLGDDFVDEALRGKQAKFTMKVLEVRRERRPALDDAFARRLGADNLDALRTSARRRLAREKEAEAERAVREQIVDRLLEKANFELPRELLEKYSKDLEARAVLRLARLGISEERLKDMRDEIGAASARNAERELRKTFVLAAIAEAEKLEVDEEDIEERIDTLARHWRVTPVAARSRLRDTGALAAIYEDIQEEKVLDFVLGFASGGAAEPAEQTDEAKAAETAQPAPEATGGDEK